MHNIGRKRKQEKDLAAMRGFCASAAALWFGIWHEP
jgi:hypothetical protein